MNLKLNRSLVQSNSLINQLLVRGRQNLKTQPESVRLNKKYPSAHHQAAEWISNDHLHLSSSHTRLKDLIRASLDGDLNATDSLVRHLDQKVCPLTLVASLAAQEIKTSQDFYKFLSLYNYEHNWVLASTVAAYVPAIEYKPNIKFVSSSFGTELVAKGRIYQKGIRFLASLMDGYAEVAVTVPRYSKKAIPHGHTAKILKTAGGYQVEDYDNETPFRSKRTVIKHIWEISNNGEFILQKQQLEPSDMQLNPELVISPLQAFKTLQESLFLKRAQQAGCKVLYPTCRLSTSTGHKIRHELRTEKDLPQNFLKALSFLLEFAS